MNINNLEITILQASKGMILTDGLSYGKEFCFKSGSRDINDFKEISLEEYETIQKQEEKELEN